MYQVYSDELYHHGILGQKWGVRRYQNEDGSLTEAGRKRYASLGRAQKNEYNILQKKIDNRKRIADANRINGNKYNELKAKRSALIYKAQQNSDEFLKTKTRRTRAGRIVGGAIGVLPALGLTAAAAIGSGGIAALPAEALAIFISQAVTESAALAVGGHFLGADTRRTKIGKSIAEKYENMSESEINAKYEAVFNKLQH